MRIVIISDLPAPSGFGRISREVAKRLAWRGNEIHAVSMMAQDDLRQEPYMVWSAAPPRDLWAKIVEVITNTRPDVVLIAQDFPFIHTLYWGCKLDWSQFASVFITPIDGTPIDVDWAKLTDVYDGAMVISKFGVEAMRRIGRRVALCHPGVDTQEFKPASPEEKKAIREKAGVRPDAFVVSMFCVNQGRKNVPATMVGFKEFALDKPEALFYFDHDRESPMGWNLNKLIAEIGLRPEQVKTRADVQAALPALRDRMCLADVHSLLSFREGSGLPVIETMACGIANVGMDWCGPGDHLAEGRGVRIPSLKQSDGTDYMTYGTWGGARDAHPDLPVYVREMNGLYANPEKRAFIARTGYEWAIKQTWDVATDQVWAEVQRAVAKRKNQPVEQAAPVPEKPVGQVVPAQEQPKPEAVTP